MKLGVERVVDKIGIIGKQEEAFTVFIKATNGINFGREMKVCERRSVVMGRELAQNAIGFVEGDNLGRGGVRNCAGRNRFLFKMTRRRGCCFAAGSTFLIPQWFLWMFFHEKWKCGGKS